MRFDHINIGASNVERLAQFYEQALGCSRFSPATDLSGEIMARGMGLDEAEVRAIWLQLPGQGEDGAFLELFEYESAVERPKPFANRIGYNHIAFEVHDLDEAVDSALKVGGTRLGDIVNFEWTEGKFIKYVFIRDPEENIVQLVQSPELTESG